MRYGVALALLLACTAAHAGEESEAHAERLFEEGRALMAKGKIAEACDRFAASEKLSRGGGTVLNLAECWAKLGRTASAWGRFREAASLARAAGRADVDKMASARADEIERDLPYLTLVIDAPDAIVKRDGESIPREAFGTDVPVDPGEHTVEATRNGFVTYRWHGTIAARERVRVSPSWVPIEIEAPKKSSPMPIVGWTMAGTGVVGLGITTILAGVASSNFSSAKTACPDPMRCGDMMAVARAHDAKTLADVATVTFISSAILAAAGLTIALVWPKEK